MHAPRYYFAITQGTHQKDSLKTQSVLEELDIMPQYLMNIYSRNKIKKQTWNRFVILGRCTVRWLTDCYLALKLMPPDNDINNNKTTVIQLAAMSHGTSFNCWTIGCDFPLSPKALILLCFPKQTWVKSLSLRQDYGFNFFPHTMWQAAVKTFFITFLCKFYGYTETLQCKNKQPCSIHWYFFLEAQPVSFLLTYSRRETMCKNRWLCKLSN